MAAKWYWTIIFTTLIVNVILLQRAIEGYLKMDYTYVPYYSAAALASALICLTTYVAWSKKEKAKYTKRIN